MNQVILSQLNKKKRDVESKLKPIYTRAIESNDPVGIEELINFTSKLAFVNLNQFLHSQLYKIKMEGWDKKFDFTFESDKFELQSVLAEVRAIDKLINDQYKKK